MREGDIAPNFRLKDQDGNDFELYKNLTAKILLIFYPKDNTPVCSSQLSEYNSNINEFSRHEIKLVGISTDSVISHLGFSSNLKLKFSLLSDIDKSVSKKYKALNLFGINKRKLVLISIDRKILWIGNMLPVNYLKSGEILSSIKRFAL